PAHVKFIFATTDPNNVPETILSRCQRYDLRRIGPADIVQRLKQICAQEKIEYEDAALSRIAGLARGGLRDAESLLDQAVNLSHGQVTDASVRELSGAAPDEMILEILKTCAQGNIADVLVKAHQALEAGADAEDMLDALVERLRGALLVKVCGANSPLLEGQTHLQTAYTELSGQLSEDQILMLMQLFTMARRQMRDATQTRLPLEMALIRAARAGDLVDLGKLVSALEAGAPPRPPPKAEIPRPNSPGRSGAIDRRPAAEPIKPVAAAPVRTAGVSSADVGIRAQLVAAAKAQKGGALIASALTYASVVKLDATERSLTLGFAPAQLFYADTLEKSDTQAALQSILTATFGQIFKINLQRLSAAEASRGGSRTAPTTTVPQASRLPLVHEPPHLSDQAGETPAVRENSRCSISAGVENSVEDTEVEFDGVDELPLRVPAPSIPSRDVTTLSTDSDDVGIETPTQRPLLPPVAPKANHTHDSIKNAPPVDLKEIQKHPLLQMVLKETGGVVIDVKREMTKNAKL
ncbi:MAG: hypothetical protein V1899_00290, partial [Planctomycetota bacterium]